MHGTMNVKRKLYTLSVSPIPPMKTLDSYVASTLLSTTTVSWSLTKTKKKMAYAIHGFNLHKFSHLQSI
jgi:hypothetical protein